MLISNTYIFWIGLYIGMSHAISWLNNQSALVKKIICCEELQKAIVEELLRKRENEWSTVWNTFVE